MNVDKKKRYERDMNYGPMGMNDVETLSISGSRAVFH